ncbi:unnamed protein product [Ostreobium quekettii]|uniref:Anaphase-promoting complex subunit 10 n=1 Tax=Ostreobium quekettii TaxID=121088 RepID=A0A8S1IZT7_9CHLO|nr:unnamed protein product [Ostreobium quekettii]|eukprot:evm.model.scf_250.10 EVM.evm.TU.scf_250.10   scf_250:99319-101612(+)
MAVLYGKEEHVNKDMREIGGQAVWSVTSAKPGNGVELLRDGKSDTYWQSDGTQPHLVNMQFQKKMLVQELHLYLDFKLDESYTPNKIAIRAGNSYYDLKEIMQIDLEEPQGWVNIPLSMEETGDCLKALLLQIAVLSNHQNGRDTHIRQIKVYGPRVDPIKALGFPINFTSKEIMSVAYVR